MTKNTEAFQLEIVFGDNFIEHHAGSIVSDPKFAIIELLANCWDAGATRVEITWPSGSGKLMVKDNGTGMTRDEFSTRWGNLNYNRTKHQGTQVEFPPGVGTRTRNAFGKNGVGRHAMFCFANEYFVESSKNGKQITAKIEKRTGEKPFVATIVSESPSQEHGTTIWCDSQGAINLTDEEISELIASRFVSDPEFNLIVNNNKIQFNDIEHLCTTIELTMSDGKTIQLKRFESDKDRTTKLHGVAWWVKKRLVGFPSWKGLDGRLLDGRFSVAKKYTYIIMADILESNVKADWSGFHASPLVVDVEKNVYDKITEDLISLMSETRKDRKKEAISANKDVIKTLPKESKEIISNFIDEVQKTRTGLKTQYSCK